MLATLYARAMESRSPDPILRDPAAEAAVDRLDYDFGRLRVRGSVPRSVAIRATYLDGWTREMLAAAPGAVVLHLGCGLDSRVDRVDPPPGVRWYDVDHPEVIELRRRVLPARRAGYATIGSSVTDPGWLEQVPADGPLVMVAEGLTMYLTGNEVVDLLTRLTRRFPRGRLAFDADSRLGVRLLRFQPCVRATGAALHWGIDDPRSLERQVPRLRLEAELAMLDVPEIARFPWPERIMIRARKRFSAGRRLGRLLRYAF